MRMVYSAALIHAQWTSRWRRGVENTSNNDRLFLFVLKHSS